MAFSSQSSAGSRFGQGRSQSSDRDPPGGAGFGFGFGRLGTNAGAAAETAGLGAAGLGAAGAGTVATGLGAGTGTGLGAAGGGGVGGAVVVGAGAVGAVVVGADAGFAFGFSIAGAGAPMRTGDASGASSLRNGLGPVGSVLVCPGPAGFAPEVGLPLAANAASSFRRSERVSDSNVGRTTRAGLERTRSSFVRGGDDVDVGASGAGMNVMSEATL